MTCWKCQENFCCLCSAKLLNKSPYEHFNDPISECYQQLYKGLNNEDGDESDDEFIIVQHENYFIFFYINDDINELMR